MQYLEGIIAVLTQIFEFFNLDMDILALIEEIYSWIANILAMVG